MDQTSALILAGILGAFGAALAVARWRLAVMAALIVVVLEGAIRKWVFPGQQQAVYFLKDLLLLGGFVGFMASSVTVYRPPEFRIFLTLAFAAATFGVIQIFNPESPSMLLGLNGFRAYFVYMPLAAMIPALFDNVGDLDKALRRYCLVVIPVSALGVLQFYSGGDSALNVYAGQSAGGPDPTQGTAFGIGEFVRATGTFPFISGFVTFLTVQIMLSFALLTSRGWKFQVAPLLFIALVAGVVGIFTTGSRSPLVIIAVCLAIASGVLIREGLMSVEFAVRIMLGLALVTVLAATLNADGIEATWKRSAEGLAEGDNRILPIFSDPIRVLGEAGITGIGIGTMHNAGPVIMGAWDAWWTKGIDYEGETGRVMGELGLFGFLLIYAIRIYVAWVALRYAHQLRNRELRILSGVVGAYLVSDIFGFVVFNPTAGVYHWFFVGLIFAFARLDAEERGVEPIGYATAIEEAIEPIARADR